jgi:hypothetical protein
VLDGQLARYADLPRDVAQLADLCAGDAIDVEGKLCWRGGEVAVGFGQNKGKSLRWLLEHDKGFLTWMMRADFAPEVKRHVDAALRGEFESRPA